MIVETVALLALAMVPNLLMAWNLLIFKEPKALGDNATGRAVSVLVPARNEIENIEDCVKAIRDAGLQDSDEIVVYDDQSDDGTGEALKSLRESIENLRIGETTPLPPGWNGKQHACARLAEQARNPVLIFLDADVRLSVGSLRVLRNSLDDRDAALVSGAPRQITQTFWERVLIPQIFVVLLGYLPLAIARRVKRPAFSAGCGQLFIADREAYRQAGGHAAIKNSRHDGLKLPATFRKAGFATDVVDLSRVASCRMYASGNAVFSGLLKNATEGMGSAGAIIPMSILLLGGQAFPILQLFVLCGLFGAEFYIATASIILSFLPRALVGFRFRQRPWDTWMQPLAIVVLVGIQWVAIVRERLGVRVAWKGRL